MPDRAPPDPAAPQDQSTQHLTGELDAAGAAPPSPSEQSVTHVEPPPEPQRQRPGETLTHVDRPQTPAGGMATQVGSVPPIQPGLPPPRFGEYELVAEVARGGMGVVYRARQLKLNRVVALKMILGGRLASADDLVRFRTEAEAAAGLQHPSIVQIHEVGEIEGQHFFSMQFIEGTTLGQRVAQGSLPGRDAARHVRQIARAVHFAHQRGILHRDLKPSNILIDARDEPHVTDFGLAKRLSGDPGHTRTGSILGTPSYMAPEQAGGRIKDLGPWTDVWALGAILYECLTGRPPFRAETPMDTVMQVLENEPVPPRLLNTKVDPELETVCLKCLEKDRRRRYQTAEELAEDLERYLNGDPIQARTTSVLDWLTRALDRSRHDVAFHTWSTMVLLLAAIVFAEHLTVYLLIQTGQPRWLITTARLTQFLLIAGIFWHNRGRRLLPTSAPERELWTIWIGYVVAYLVNAVVLRSLVDHQVIVRGPGAPARWAELIVYPFSALLSGLAFFVMGSNYWGRCYAAGVLFFGLAFLVTFALPLAPLAFGVLWGVTLVALGLHLRRLGQREAEGKGAVELPSGLTQDPSSSARDL
jgi:serine/threonine protein kinase